MTSRELPAEEWARLDGTDLGAALALCDPARVRVAVVEDGDQIVACWGAFVTVHAEGVWIDPRYRSGGVAVRLYRAMRQIVRGLGFDRVITGANQPDVAALLAKHGTKLEMQPYVLPLKGVVCL